EPPGSQHRSSITPDGPSPPSGSSRRRHGCPSRRPSLSACCAQHARSPSAWGGARDARPDRAPPHVVTQRYLRRTLCARAVALAARHVQGAGAGGREVVAKVTTYQVRGEVPAKRHTQAWRDGRLLAEEVVG